MKLIILLAMIVTLAGCENGNVTLTEKDRIAEKTRVKKRGEARNILFKECMELAAKMPRQADDDVSDIVAVCSDRSYHMTNYIE